MNRLWRYKEYVDHLSHHSEIVRRWAFDALNNRFRNRYTDQVADLINDPNEYLACGALQYLSFHHAVQHTAAILERFHNSQGIVAGKCAATLAKMRFEPAQAAILDRFNTTQDYDTIFGILDYLGAVHTEKCRTALKSALNQMQDTFLLGAATANLLGHQIPDDIALVMGRFFDSGSNLDRHDLYFKSILMPLGCESYYKELTESGPNKILSKPAETIDKLVSDNPHLNVTPTLCEAWVALLEKRRYLDLVALISQDARNKIRRRYDGKADSYHFVMLEGQDTMSLCLLEDLLTRQTLWKRMDKKKTSAAELISFVMSLAFGLNERSAYVRALTTESNPSALMQLLQHSGPHLPDHLLEKIKKAVPISELKASLSKDLLTWGDIWAVRLMGRIGHQEFLPELIRVLNITDALDYIYNDALSAINGLDESAEESIIKVIKNREIQDWAAFAILEHLPYTEAFTLAVDLWENPGDDPMDSNELFSTCLAGIGDRNGIKKLQDLYAHETDDGSIGDALECLSLIHGSDIPELPDIKNKRAHRIQQQQIRMAELDKLFNLDHGQDEHDLFESIDRAMPFKRESPKVGRNDPCPCGSGKKYKKCCLN